MLKKYQMKYMMNMPELVEKLGKINCKCDTCHSISLKIRNMYLIKPSEAVTDLVKDYRYKICNKCYNREFRKK